MSTKPLTEREQHAAAALLPGHRYTVREMVEAKAIPGKNGNSVAARMFVQRLVRKGVLRASGLKSDHGATMNAYERRETP